MSVAELAKEWGDINSWYSPPPLHEMIWMGKGADADDIRQEVDSGDGLWVGN